MITPVHLGLPWLLICLAAASVEAQTCPSGWVVYSGHCYYFHNEYIHLTWEQTETFCENQGAADGITATLPSIHSEAENAFIYDEVKDEIFTWIGLGQVTAGGPYVWVDGTPVTYTNWDTGYPRAPDTSTICALISYNSNGVWHSNNCNTQLQANEIICKSTSTVGTTTAPTTVTTVSSTTATTTTSACIPDGQPCSENPEESQHMCCSNVCYMGVCSMGIETATWVNP